jgi:hypothetical protein
MFGLTLAGSTRSATRAVTSTPVVTVGQWMVLSGGCVAHWNVNGAPVCEVLDRLKHRVRSTDWSADATSQRCGDCIHRIRYPRVNA